LDSRIDFLQRFPDKILAGHAEIDRAVAEFAGNLRRGQESDLDFVAALDAGTVAARIFRLRDGQAGTGEKLQRRFLQPSLRGQGKGDAHAGAPAASSMRSSHAEKPTAGMCWRAPSRVSSRS